MALASLWRDLCPFPNLPRLHCALAALRIQPVYPVSKRAQEHLCPQLCPLRPSPPGTRFHPACCKQFHSERRNNLHAQEEPASPQAHPCDTLGGKLETLDGQSSCRQLGLLTSSQDVLSFLSTRRALPETVAVGALQQICELESTGGRDSLPPEILHSPVFCALCRLIEQEPSSLSSEGMVAALQALARLQANPQGGLLSSLVAECQHRLRRGDLGVHSLCILGESLVRLRGPNCLTLELVLDELQKAQLEDLAPEDVVAVYRTLQACPEKVDRYQALLNKIHALFLSSAFSLSPTAISQVLTALVVLDQTQALPLVIKLGRCAVRHVPRLTSGELGGVLEAFAYFGHSDRFFTETLEQHLTAQRLTLDPETLCRVAQYCGRKLILSRPVLDAVADAFVGQPDRFSPRQVAELLEPFGRLNYLPPSAPALLQKLEGVLRARFRDFPPRALLRLLHSCSLVECHPVNFLPWIFSPLFLQRLQGEESHLDRLSLAQLTQLLLTSLLECPFYKGPRLLPKYQVRSFFTPCCTLETPVDLHLYRIVMKALLDLLGARGYFASKVLTPYCYTIDIELKLDEDGFVLPSAVTEDVHRRVALCIDDPRRFCLNSRHLLGKEAIKRRHLRLLGYKVIQIPHYELELLKSRLEVVEYLQRKLFLPDTGARQ